LQRACQKFAEPENFFACDLILPTAFEENRPMSKKSKVLTVKITGAQGVGKTLVARELVPLLRKLGYAVTLIDDGEIACWSTPGSGTPKPYRLAVVEVIQ
jgi:pantothenate kinase-related protein Tda10